MNLSLTHRAIQPQQGHFIRYRPEVDAGENRIVDDLDFVAVKAVLDAVDSGDAEAMLAVNDTMEARDAWLQSVAHTRRASLTVMQWTIDPPEGIAEELQPLADKAAEYLRSKLGEIETFGDCLKAMSGAIGPNLAVVENIWEGAEIVAFEPTGYQRLVIQRELTEDVRIITDTAPDGEVPPAYKFIVHVPENTGNFMFTRTIARAQAPLFVAKKLADMDWRTFAEIFGMPVRVAIHNKEATKAQKTETIRALAAMGSRAYMLLSEDIKYELKEAARNTEPYSVLVAHIEKVQAVGYLGQNLTTDTTGSGGLGGAGAAQVHQDVRRLLTEEDAVSEERTLRRTLFPWMLRFRFPQTWHMMPTPRFRRMFRDGTSRIDKAEAIRKATQEMDIPVSMDWARRELGIPAPGEGEELIKRIEPVIPASPFGI